jgi:lipopolysaccharide assembly protein A
MRVLAWIVRLFLFMVALGFALSNDAITEVRFFRFETLTWRAPLVIFLLGFLGAGFVLGVLGVLPTLFRQRRELGRLGRELKAMSKTAAGGAAAPMPDVPLPPRDPQGAQRSA